MWYMHSSRDAPCVVAGLQVPGSFLRQVKRLFDLCTSLQSILCGRHCVKSERKQGATLDSIQLFTPSGSFRSPHKRNIFESTSRQNSFFGLYKVSILVVSIDKLKMRAHIEFLFQVILIWLGSSHLFGP